MSDIPKARALLIEALSLLDRKKPAFRSKARYPRLTEHQKEQVRELRREGASMNYIARKMNTNLGRVSEAVNG